MRTRFTLTYDLDGRARTFMRSVVSEDANVGLLLFDEPSASLDPVAEAGKPFVKTPFSLRPLSVVACRPLRPAARASREQDDVVLITPFRKPDTPCRSHIVREFVCCLM